MSPWSSASVQFCAPQPKVLSATRASSTFFARQSLMTDSSSRVGWWPVHFTLTAPLACVGATTR